MSVSYVCVFVRVYFVCVSVCEGVFRVCLFVNKHTHGILPLTDTHKKHTYEIHTHPQCNLRSSLLRCGTRPIELGTQ